MNNPTLTEFCFGMIGRADIEGSKSNVAMNAWLPQASSFGPSGAMPPLAPLPACATGVSGSTVSGGRSPYLKPRIARPTPWRALNAPALPRREPGCAADCLYRRGPQVLGLMHWVVNPGRAPRASQDFPASRCVASRLLAHNCGGARLGIARAYAWDYWLKSLW